MQNRAKFRAPHSRWPFPFEKRNRTDLENCAMTKFE